ncbi:UbiA prenyltransferase family protein [Seonamhaeicola marinus]|uniref:Prenyltransferase n=1 Tax=Seonamhaeicola marinus TaxID=1912246 RepID=A0A5D0HHT2_9FLAO|nr:hypothetical protein [Seonamhaeicola marinus]TYA69829.1 hypothetical protein FUA24_21275 [Seonamhaeicola marinus]
MAYLKQLLNFYINSSIHVALSVVALAVISFLELNLYINIDLLLFTFFASVTGYNFVKYFGIAKFHHRSLARWLKAIQVFSLFCFIAMCYYAFKLEKSTLWYIAGFGLITFFYAIPFLPKDIFVDKKQNLRSIGGLKIYLIALVWSGVTVFLPLLNEGANWHTDILILGIQRYLFIIVLMFPFEIRDLKFDSLKLSTIPQRIGVRNTKVIGFVLLVIIILLDLLKVRFVLYEFAVLSVFMMLTLVLLLKAEKTQDKYYSAFWVEGIPILWALALLTVS